MLNYGRQRTLIYKPLKEVVMKSDDYKERLQQAALKGVIDRLQNDQAYYVVGLMKKCLAPEAVYKSKKVKQLALDFLKEGFNRYNLIHKDRVKSTANLMKAVKVPESEVVRIILDYFVKYTKSSNRLPRDFELIMNEFPVTAKDLNSRDLCKVVIIEIGEGAFENVYHRQRCFLKYFNLPRESIDSMVRRALSFYAYKKEYEAQLDEFIKATGYNRGEILTQLSAVIANLISEGEMGDVEVLVKKYKYPTALLINDSNKKLAIEGVLEQLGSREFEDAQQIVNLFALTKDDFEESALLKTVESSLDYDDFKTAESIMIFAGLSIEEIAALIRRNLENIVLAGAEYVWPLTDKYGIDRKEVATAAENAVVKGLSGWAGKDLKEVIEGYGLSKEFLASERVVAAAKEGLIGIYEICDCNDDADFLVDTFGLKI